MPKKTESVSRDIFHPLYLDLFWKFLAERQKIWYLRAHEGKDAPWTEDTVLQNEFITNIYRELDPGTAYVLDHILETAASPQAKIFNIMFYRLMGSQFETHARIVEKLGLIDPEDYEQEAFLEVLIGWEKEGNLVFGDSYRVAPYQDEGGKDKKDNVSRLFSRLARDFRELYKGMRSASSSRQLYEQVNGIRGFGDFLSFQITMDLLYPVEMMAGRGLFDFSHNDWAMAGPGAKQGIYKLMKPNTQPTSHVEVMRWLQENMPSEMERLGLPFIYLEDPMNEGEPKWLHIADMQSSLCEFNKYVRIWMGESKNTRRFKKPTSSPADLKKVPVVLKSPASDMQSISDVVVRTFTPPVPSAVEHERLVSVALAGGKSLSSVAGYGEPGDAQGPQAVLDYAAKFAQAAGIGALGEGVVFNDGQPRLVLLNPLGQLGDDVPYALLIIPILRSGAGVAPVHNLEALSAVAPDPDHAAAGEAEVKTED